MASHLTIVSSTAASRAFGGQSANHQDATSEAGGLLGIFGALLSKDAQAAAVSDKAASLSTDGADIDLAALLAGIGGEENSQDEQALLDALGVAIVQPVPVNPRPMLAFINAMAALKTSLDGGDVHDPALVAEAEAAFGNLAEALGFDPSGFSAPADFAALLAGTDADGTGPGANLAQLLTPIAVAIADRRAQTDAPIRSLSDKISALMAATEAGEVSADKLIAIGMSEDGPVEEIEAALNRFIASAKQASVPDAPELAAPALKLTETVLTGKTADSADPAETASPPTKAVETAPDTSGAGRDTGDDRQARERPELVRAERPVAVNANAAPVADSAPTANATPGADAAQVRVDAAANPRVIQAGYQTSQQQLNLPQIAFELARQVQDGNTRFQIRLDPPELGRIDVRLDIDKSGQVNARLMVEKAETLDLMQRDQRGLERALQQAGIDAGKTNLEFSLKQNPFSGQFGQGERQGGGADGNGEAGTGNAEAEPLPTVNLYRGSLQASGVNIIA